MPSIRSLVLGIQKEDPRIFDAFLEIERRLSVLGSGSGGLSNYARAFSSGALTIATATPTLLAFNSTLFQSGGMHSDSTLNTRMTIFTAGFYSIFGNIEWPVNAVGVREFEILVNGGVVIGKSKISTPSAVVAENQIISSGYYLSAGDYVELRVNQTSGGNLIIPSTAHHSPEFTIVAN